MTQLLRLFSYRQWLLLTALACACMICIGLYLQLVVGLVPCPMCIVQRYAIILIAIVALLASIFSAKAMHIGGTVLMFLLALAGGFVAARQSWLQWHPPVEASCGRDFYGMIETFPLKRVLPMIFKGSGDCIKVDWTLLGGSLANWSFVCFVGLALFSVALLVWGPKARR